MAQSPQSPISKISDLLGNSHIGVLSPIEMRLTTIAMQALKDILIMLRIGQDSTGLKPMTPEMVATAMRLSLAGAVAIDEDLRALRASLEAHRG